MGADEDETPVVDQNSLPFWMEVGDQEIRTRYPRYFQIKLGDGAPDTFKTPRALLGRFIKSVNNAVYEMDRCTEAEKTRDLWTAGQLSTLRDQHTSRLRAVCSQFFNCEEPEEKLLYAVGKTFGEFEGRRRLYREHSKGVVIVSSENTKATNIIFYTSGLKLSEGLRNVILDINRALTVVNGVFARGTERSWAGRFAKNTAQSAEALAVRRQDEYISKLAHIARESLQGKEDPVYATRRLDAFKEEFVSLEADGVKNRYVARLGLHCALWGSAFFAAWILCHAMGTRVASLEAVGWYFLTAMGACAGTWLSFSIRRVSLTFDDLALLEEDRLRPTARILFVVGLTTIISLLIMSPFIALNLNGQRLSIDDPLKALLIGALCGVSERALAGAVSRRSAAVVAQITDQPPAPEATGSLK